MFIVINNNILEFKFLLVLQADFTGIFLANFYDQLES